MSFQITWTCTTVVQLYWDADRNNPNITNQTHAYYWPEYVLHYVSNLGIYLSFILNKIVNICGDVWIILKLDNCGVFV